MYLIVSIANELYHSYSFVTMIYYSFIRFLFAFFPRRVQQEIRKR